MSPHFCALSFHMCEVLSNWTGEPNQSPHTSTLTCVSMVPSPRAHPCLGHFSSLLHLPTIVPSTTFPLHSTLNHIFVNDWDSKIIINLSRATIDPLALRCLKRGLNFVIAPRVIPHIDFLSSIKHTIHSLPMEDTTVVGKHCATALRHA